MQPSQPAYGIGIASISVTKPGIHLPQKPAARRGRKSRDQANAESGSKAGAAADVIQAPKPEPRIMRYELGDYEWKAIKPILPNNPRSGRCHWLAETTPGRLMR